LTLLFQAERKLAEDRRLALERARMDATASAEEIAAFEAAMKALSTEDADLLKPYREELCEWINGTNTTASTT
jgi:hypothetical protein